MAILFGIDGTGARSFNEYDDNTADSFVRRLCQLRADVRTKKYERGPTLEGARLDDAIQSGLSFINQHRNRGNNSPIIMTGHSRGAAGVIVVAKRLAERNIPVRALMLFDCVNRHWVDSSVIPTNVQQVMHVRRHPRARSRESFGNSGTRWHPPTNYRTEYFMGTHGGMGGTYWKPEDSDSESKPGMNDYVNEGFPDFRTNITYQQDLDNSTAVWNYVQPFLRQNGFIN